MDIKLRFVAILIPLSFILYSCDDDDDSEAKLNVPFSLGVSDAPFDEADAVFIQIDKITLTSNDGTIKEIEDFNGNTSISINLMEYQGADQVTIVNESQGIELQVGTAEMELTIIDAGSYVLLTGDTYEYPIKVPSSRLRLGEFDVVLGAEQVEDVPGFTIEFDLRTSLVQRGNDPEKNGFIIKPHGVKITSSASSGTIAGTVDMDAFMSATEEQGACDSTDNFVYLYKDNVVSSEDQLIDIVDINSEDYTGTPEIPAGSIEPYASSPVNYNSDTTSYSYEFGFVPNGDSFDGGQDIDAATYTVAFVCGTAVKEDPNNYDELMIPNPSKQLKDVIVLTGETVTVDFPL